MKNKFLIIIIVLIPVLFIASQVWKKHIAMQLISGGYGTQFKDSPYPFNNPSYPVRCRLKTYQVDAITLKVQQEQVTLRIPTDALGGEGVRKRADAQECEPMSIFLRFIFFDDKLLRGAGDTSEAVKAGYPIDSIGVIQLVEVKLIDLLDSPAQAREKGTEISANTDLNRYSERLPMKHFPLWLYPNAKYVEQEHNNQINRNLNLPQEHTYKYGYGVLNSVNPLTNQPYFVTCGISRSNVKAIDPDTLENRKKVINATDLHKTASGICKGSYYIVTDETILSMTVTVNARAVKHIDKIYAQLDDVIKSYLVPRAKSTETLSITEE